MLELEKVYAASQTDDLILQVICSEYRQFFRDAISLLNNGKHLRARTKEHYVFCWNLKRPKCIIHRSFMLRKSSHS